MSSFIVNDLTINRILTFLSRWDFGHNLQLRSAFEREVKSFLIDNDENLQKIGKVLITLNWDATNQRYSGELSKEEDELIKDYKYEYAPTSLEQAYKHLGCLTYQMSEGDIPETKLYKILEEIEDQMARAIAWKVIEKMNLEWEAKEEIRNVNA